MKYLFLIQARTASTRLPKKVLAEVLSNITLVEMVYRQVRKAKAATANNTIILTSTSPADDELTQFAEHKGISVARGEEHNVFKRYVDFLKTQAEPPDYIFRICGDNPFLEPIFIEKLIDLAEHHQGQIDYLSYQEPKTNKPAILTHYGLFCEMISSRAFLAVKETSLSATEKEHVTPIFYQTSNFQTSFIDMPDNVVEYNYRLTVDTAADLDLVRQIYQNIDPDHFTFHDVIETIKNKPDYLNAMADNIKRNPK